MVLEYLFLDHKLTFLFQNLFLTHLVFQNSSSSKRVCSLHSVLQRNKFPNFKVNYFCLENKSEKKLLINRFFRPRIDVGFVFPHTYHSLQSFGGVLTSNRAFRAAIGLLLIAFIRPTNPNEFDVRLFFYEPYLLSEHLVFITVLKSNRASRAAMGLMLMAFVRPIYCKKFYLRLVFHAPYLLFKDLVYITIVGVLNLMQLLEQMQSYISLPL